MRAGRQGNLGTALALASMSVAALLPGLVFAARDQIVTIEHQRSEMVLVPGGFFVMGAGKGERKSVFRACKAQLGSANLHCASLDFTPARGSLIGTIGRRPRGTAGPHPRLVPIPARRVYVSPFWIDRHEVAVHEYRACVSAGRCSLTPLVTGDAAHLAADKPIVNVTWQDAVDYCHFRRKRLPTEAEWEKAARGTRGWRWPWGNHDRADGANHGRIQAESVLLAHSVQNDTFPMFRPDPADGVLHAARPGFMRWGQSPYGAYDMAGNVSEWVADWYSEEGYHDLTSFNPHRSRPQIGQYERVARGGSWYEPRYMSRTYVRAHDKPDVRRVDRGFRCARDASHH